MRARSTGPWLVRTAAWPGDIDPTGVLANVRDAGEKASLTAESIALPLRATFCGLLGSLSTIVRLSELEPDDVGLKTTAIVQAAPAASMAGATGHVVELTAKDEPALIAVMVSGTDARFDSITFCAGDV